MPLVYSGQRVTSGVLSLNYSASDIGAVTVTAATLTDLTATFSVPANDAVAGNMYEIEAWGNGTQGSTAQGLTFQPVFATQVLSPAPQIGTVILPISQIFRWRCVIRVICLTTGVTGTFSSLVFGEISANANPLNYTTDATTGFTECESTGTYTVDTTAAQGLKLQAVWASVTGAPTVTKRIAIQRKLGIG
jgi:hypothetical protein